MYKKVYNEYNSLSSRRKITLDGADILSRSINQSIIRYRNNKSDFYSATCLFFVFLFLVVVFFFD